jgi:hypothetical protein
MITCTCTQNTTQLRAYRSNPLRTRIQSTEFHPRQTYRSNLLKMRNKFNHNSTPMLTLCPAQTPSSVDAFGRLTGVFHLSSALS